MWEGDYVDIALGPQDEAALGRLVDGCAAAILEILAGAEIAEPLCSVALYQGQEEELDALPIVFAGRASDRERILREGGPEDWIQAWNAWAFRDEEDVIHPADAVTDDGYAEQVYRDLSPAHLEDWARVRAAIEAHNAGTTVQVGPADWVLTRVARALNRMRLPVPTTGDVAVWLCDGHLGEGDVIEHLEFVLRPETLGALRATGVVGEDSEAGTDASTPRCTMCRVRPAQRATVA